MALQDTLYVNEFSSPLITKQLLDFRNDSIMSSGGSTNSQNIIPVTGYTFQLVIKRTPVGIRVQDGYPQVYDADQYSVKYTGSVLSNPTGGIVTFQLDLNATCCYGNYVAEFRWWATGVPTTQTPTDRVTTNLVVARVLNSTYP